MTTTDDVGVLVLWARRQAKPQQIEVRCAEAPPDLVGGDVSVRLTGCLADATLTDLAELVGATSALRLRLDACSRPDDGPTPALAALLSALGLPGERLTLEAGTTTGARELDVRRLPPRRRGLVGWFLPTQPEPEPVDESPGQRTSRVVAALGGGADLPEAAAALPSQALDLRSTGCTACGTCVRVCPTGVLQLTSTVDGRRLEFDSAGCIACGECIDICPAGALAADGHLTWGELDAVTLEELHTRTCGRCRAEFAGAGELCPVCAARRASPFGSSLPPHLAQRPVSRRR